LLIVVVEAKARLLTKASYSQDNSLHSQVDPASSPHAVHGNPISLALTSGNRLN